MGNKREKRSLANFTGKGNLGKLYIVATPIGNLEDITLRALRILKEVDLVLTEDTRRTNTLLMHYEIYSHVLSYHQHSGEEKKLEILNLLLSGKNIALVTDAGTPGISDPGNELIEFLLGYEKNLEIIPIPGSSALTTALSVSGIDVRQFVFLGFFPKKKKSKTLNLIKMVQNDSKVKMPIVFFESPNRIIKTLINIEEVLGSVVDVYVGRELTKLHEMAYRGRIKNIIDGLKKEKLRGEFVVVIRCK